MTQDERKQPVVLTRDELYAQVWSTPMRRLAAQYGITGTGLAKICARHIIPCPPRGYWTKKAAGKPVVQYRLPEPKADAPLMVTITPAPPLSEAQTKLRNQIETARDTHAQIVVPTQLRRPHRIIAEWLAEHKRKAQQARQERDPSMRRMMQPKAFTDTDHREHRFLDALFKALEPLGFAIKSEPYQRVYLEFQKERVDFQLREKQKQARRPLTEDEKRWSWNSDREWKQELQPTGVLVFSIKTWLAAGMRREWKDASDKHLEQQLPDIIATFSLVGPFLVNQQRERAEAEKRRWEEAHRRHLEQERREKDEKRWMRFLEFAQRREQAASTRRLLVELENRPQLADLTFGGLSPAAWLAWAHEWLERFDPLTQTPETLYKELASI